jgi:hypothetical protein
MIGLAIGLSMFWMFNAKWLNEYDAFRKSLMIINLPAWGIMSAWVKCHLPIDGDFGWITIYQRAVVFQWAAIGILFGLFWHRGTRPAPHQGVQRDVG